MRIDGEQETEVAADAVDVCGWLISLNLISLIVDPPDGRVPRVYRPNFASQFSRLESEGRSTSNENIGQAQRFDAARVADLT